LAAYSAVSSAFPGQGNPGGAAAQANVRAIGPETVVRVPWGSGPAELGRLDGNESASEGPMSFALAPDGSVWFLDQTRYRLARFDGSGQLLQEIGLPSNTFQDVELTSSGWFVLLDRLARRTMVVVDPMGNVVRTVPIEGPGIPDGGLVTGMWVDDKGVWLEHFNEHRVRVLNTKLQPCTRDIEPGRPFGNGLNLFASLNPRGNSPTLWTELPNGDRIANVLVPTSHAVSRIVSLETDGAGDVYAILHLLEFDPGNVRGVTHEEILGVRYDSNLRQRATWTSQWVIREWEQFREVRIARDGTVYQMGFEEDAVVVARWRWVP